jgi:hypothetical protein
MLAQKKIITRNDWSINLQAIENCIFGITVVERKVMPNLRPVRVLGI